MIILAALTLKNVRHIRAVPLQRRQQIRVMTKKDIHLLRCLYAHKISYIICSIPAITSGIYSSTIRYRAPTPFEQAMSLFLSGVGVFIYNIPYCTSFFIFTSVSRAFRRELKRLIYRTVGKDFQRIREEEAEVAENNIPATNLIISTIT